MSKCSELIEKFELVDEKLKELRSKMATYDVIKKLSGTPSIYVGDYEYKMDDGSIEKGHAYATTKELLKNKDHTPVVRVKCKDGWVDVQDYPKNKDSKVASII
jgi:hypothetical protein